MDKEGDQRIGVEGEECSILGCYVSPNIGIREFEERIDLWRDIVRRQSGEVVLMGDFNSKSPEWGHQYKTKGDKS